MKNDYREWEFKIVSGPHSEVQKWLNQWRHQYEMIFHKVEFSILEIREDDREWVKILLSRRKLC